MRIASALLLTLGLSACSADPGPAPSTTDAGADAGCVVGASRCEGGREAMCEQGATGATWGPLHDCGETQVCAANACTEVTPRQKAQASVLAQYTHDLRDYTGYDAPLDFNALEGDARRMVFLGDASDGAFAKAIHHVFRGVPQGHMAVGFGPSDFSACSSREAKIPTRGQSWYGVCARAAGDASIVTFAAADNPMGLRAGDRVIQVERGTETWASPGFLDRIGEEPLCESSVPSTDARADYAASNLFALLNEGAKVTVLAPDGTSRVVTVPPRTATPRTCYDAFQRPEGKKAFSTFQRPDGVVVVTLPTLGSHPDHPFPTGMTLATYRNWTAESITRVNAALSQYPQIAGIVWDIRGNTGGSAEYALGLIAPSFMVGSEGGFASCFRRLPASSPPAFATAAEYPFPYQVFVDQPLPQLSFQGKSVVLTDGLSVSAGDWFAFAASKAGVPVVGHASAGAYGYTTGKSYVDKSIAPASGIHPGIASYISGARCVEKSTGRTMEGTPPLDGAVDLDPRDLAAGKDTQLEAAVARVN